MLRVLLAWLVPLLLPTAAYLAYMYLRGRNQPGWLREGPWVWLVASGLLLMALTLGAWALLGGGRPGEVYVPPHFEDGRLVPGRSLPPGSERPAFTPKPTPALPAEEAVRESVGGR
jgi:hypothetical protein